VTQRHDVWAAGEPYERYVGRWSRQVAKGFLAWLALPAGLRWLDAGCGTGALTATIRAAGAPAEVTGVDPSEGFLASARAHVDGVAFVVGDAQTLPFPDHRFDVVVSGLALNFVPDPARAAAEFARVVAPGGTVAGYVWDYAVGMRMMRLFWDAAAAVDPGNADLDEGTRFPLCNPGPLSNLWVAAGLRDVDVHGIEIPTVFRDIDDYWQPFLGGQGAAPGYYASLPAERQDALRADLFARLPVEPGGTIRLTARAWAVRGRR
jgi:SAM-dependent methyltransferase